MTIYEAISRFSPFQRDKRTMLPMISHKAFVQLFTLSFQHPHRHFHASVPKFLYATTLHLRKWVFTPYHTTLEILTYQQVGTRRCFAIMTARFQTHIDGAFLQQMLILFPHRCTGIHLCVTFSTTHMVTFTDDSVLMYNHSPHHRVWLSILLTISGQLKTPSHILLVSYRHAIHNLSTQLLTL